MLLETKERLTVTPQTIHFQIYLFKNGVSIDLIPPIRVATGLSFIGFI